jgi:quercetin dioxygenase-like cupin family protein
MTLSVGASQVKPLERSSLRLVLLPGQVMGLSSRRQSLRVLSGKAWVSWKGEDIIIEPGQSVSFVGRGDRPLVSEIGHNAAVVELTALDGLRWRK